MLTATPFTAVTVQSTVLTDPPSLSTAVYVYVGAFVPTATPPRVHAYTLTVLPVAGVAVNGLSLIHFSEPTRPY